ncbi:MAG: sulfite exporter TauE/SafE family protein [Candidatus Gracilibacteria bacterium]|jgi:hypothetical protein
MWEFIIIFAVSLLATILSTISGGGSGIISLPVFLWLGISLPLSIAIQKVNAIFFTPIPAYNYLKGKKIDWTFLLLFAFIGLIGVYAGVNILLAVDKILMQRAIGLIIFAFAIFVFLKKDFGMKERTESSKIKRAASYFAALIMGFYESLMGSGNGIAFTALTYYTRGFDFIHAMGYYFAIAFFWCTFTAILYIQKGYFDFWMMLASILGAMIGAQIGSKYARYKGNKFIKTVFTVVGVVLGLKLFLNL